MKIQRLPDKFDRAQLTQIGKVEVLTIPSCIETKLEEIVKRKLENHVQTRTKEINPNPQEILCDYELIEVSDSSNARYSIGLQLYKIPEKDREKVFKALAQYPANNFAKISRKIDSAYA